MEKVTERLQTIDLVLPSIDLNPEGVFIALEISEKQVNLRIGGRDIYWSRETGRVTNTGMFIDPNQAEMI